MLLIMTVAADAAMLVSRFLPGAAGIAEELHKQRLNSSEQAAQHTSTFAGERASSCASSAVVVQWSISQLTLVEALMCAEPGQLPSLCLLPVRQTVRGYALVLE